MDGQLSEQVKKDRADTLRALTQVYSEKYRRGFIGRCLEIIPEHRKKNGVWSAHSPYSFPVYIRDDRLHKNIPVTVKITDILDDGLEAKIFL